MIVRSVGVHAHPGQRYRTVQARDVARNEASDRHLVARLNLALDAVRIAGNARVVPPELDSVPAQVGKAVEHAGGVGVPQPDRKTLGREQVDWLGRPEPEHRDAFGLQRQVEFDEWLQPGARGEQQSLSGVGAGVGFDHDARAVRRPIGHGFAVVEIGAVQRRLAGVRLDALLGQQQSGWGLVDRDV
jgi:hypothetical protein